MSVTQSGITYDLRLGAAALDGDLAQAESKIKTHIASMNAMRIAIPVTLNMTMFNAQLAQIKSSMGGLGGGAIGGGGGGIVNNATSLNTSNIGGAVSNTQNVVKNYFNQVTNTINTINNAAAAAANAAQSGGGGSRTSGWGQSGSALGWRSGAIGSIALAHQLFQRQQAIEEARFQGSLATSTDQYFRSQQATIQAQNMGVIGGTAGGILDIYDQQLGIGGHGGRLTRSEIGPTRARQQLDLAEGEARQASESSAATRAAFFQRRTEAAYGAGGTAGQQAMEREAIAQKGIEEQAKIRETISGILFAQREQALKGGPQTEEEKRAARLQQAEIGTAQQELQTSRERTRFSLDVHDREKREKNVQTAIGQGYQVAGLQAYNRGDLREQERQEFGGQMERQRQAAEREGPAALATFQKNIRPEKEKEFADRQRKEEEQAAAESVDKINAYRAGKEEATLRLAGHEEEAATRAFRAQWDDREAKLTEAYNQETDLVEKSRRLSELRAAQDERGAAAAVFNENQRLEALKKTQRGEEEVAQIEGRIRQDNLLAQGHSEAAKKEAFDNAWNERVKRLEDARRETNDPAEQARLDAQIGATKSERDAATAARDAQDARRVTGLRGQNRENYLRGQGQTGTADLLEIKRKADEDIKAAEGNLPLQQAIREREAQQVEAVLKAHTQGGTAQAVSAQNTDLRNTSTGDKLEDTNKLLDAGNRLLKDIRNAINQPPKAA